MAVPAAGDAGAAIEPMPELSRRRGGAQRRPPVSNDLEQVVLENPHSAKNPPRQNRSAGARDAWRDATTALCAVDAALGAVLHRCWRVRPMHVGRRARARSRVGRAVCGVPQRGRRTSALLFFEPFLSAVALRLQVARGVARVPDGCSGVSAEAAGRGDRGRSGRGWECGGAAVQLCTSLGARRLPVRR